MQELQELARKLLTDGTVKVVIGYEAGPRGVRAAFVTSPTDVGRLIFDSRCVQNLVTYLSPRRSLVRELGKPAVVVKTCDSRAVSGMLRESQLKREDVVLIGVRCGGVVHDPTDARPLGPETVADRCVECATRDPERADHLVGPAQPAPAGHRRRDDLIAELLEKSAEERLAFWTGELSRCVRCHACREVCPLCFCERCLADKTVPGWLESSPHPRGNLAFHLTRAMHMAGRCVDCGECERVCPADIPLGLIGRRIAQVVAERFEHSPTEDPAVPAPVGSYRLQDKEEFIR